MQKSRAYYERGKRFLSSAIDADEREACKKALELYDRACENFILGLKYDPVSASRQQVTEKVKSYLGRAELLKSTIKHNEAQRSLNRKHKKNIPQQNPYDKIKATVCDESETKVATKEPQIGFSDVAGLDNVKSILKETVLLPMLQPQLFKGARKPWKGILLYGPPGTGKTMVARALASESNASFICLSASDIVSKHQGDSEKAIRSIFEMARQKKPCVLFFDEIDSIGGTRRDDDDGESARRILTELLSQMDGVSSESNKGVTVIGATNLPFALDPALRRRFEKRVYVPLPDEKTRAKVLKLSFGENNEEHRLVQKDFDNAANQTAGYSNSDLAAIAKEALMAPVRKCMNSEYFKEVWNIGWSSMLNGKAGRYLVPCDRNEPGARRMRMLDPSFDARRLRIPPVLRKDLHRAIVDINPSVSKDGLAMYEKFTQLFGEKGGKKDNQTSLQEDVNQKPLTDKDHHSTTTPNHVHELFENIESIPKTIPEDEEPPRHQKKSRVLVPS